MADYKGHDDVITGHERERRDSNAENSNPENDTFEDAPVDQGSAVSPTESTRERLLTGNRVSSTSQGTILSEESPSTNGNEVHDDEHTSKPKSPLLTSHRLSTASLDNVDLEGDNNPEILPKVPAKDNSSKHQLLGRSPTPSALMGLSGALPSMPWQAPPPPPPIQASRLSNPAQAPRKLTSPFSWLSRNNANKDSIVSPPLPQLAASTNTDRRNTASSIATLNSNPELMLSKLEEGQESPSLNGTRHPARYSLRDRFKLLRLREEAGVSLGEEDQPAGSTITGLIGRNASMGLGIVSSNALDDPPPTSPIPTSPSGHINHALAPGTAAGVSVGPPIMTDSEPVDWDLWQSVVYEGPAAVARTSPEELNKAIATGIPSAIRGVVWQVLAQSKNDELESVYKDLLSRGTDHDRDRMSASSGGTNSSNNMKDKDVTMSSASSVHSDHSTLATSTTNGIRSPSPSKEVDSETIAKAQAAALLERKKKAKEDAASLQKLEKVIKRDLGARTSFSKFAASAGLQEGLFGVCKAYALFDEGVGYAQGMNFLVMPLLFNMPEEEAFCLLVRLMNQYHLRDLFIQDMPGLHMHLYQFERLLEDFEPALYCHLHRRQVTPHLYATQWFLTLFAYRFPLQLVLRIYDLILSEGMEAILKFGIVLMQKNATTLLGMSDMGALTKFLKDRLFDVYIDQAPSAGSILESGFFGSSGASIDKEIYRADMLVQDACAVKITPELLKTYTAEWEEKTRSDAAVAAELETLKSSNQNLSMRVRRLEERVEEHDAEHAALATELVRTKVENEELKDENENLRGQVRELTAVVEKQPEEVEKRLKTEMDRLLKRNQEVHEENTRLEEEMGEMEQTLVLTKMQYAETQSEHEMLTRKWNDLRKALD